MERKIELINIIKSILEFMKENLNRFNDEKLYIMSNMPDYINDKIEDNESLLMVEQIKAIEETLNSAMDDSDYDSEFCEKFKKRDLFSLLTMYFMAVSINKDIFKVYNKLIYYFINSLRGEMYDHYPVLLKGLLYNETINKAIKIQSNDPSDTDSIKILLNGIVDGGLLKDNMSDEEIETSIIKYINEKNMGGDALINRL